MTSDETNVFIIISYACGYACGTFIGWLINKYFVKGMLSAMIIIPKENITLVEALKKKGYGVSVMELKDTVNRIDNTAFIIINETLHVENGFFN